MVSSSHEAMHRIFQHDPRLFSRVSEALGIPLPQPTAVRLLPTDVTETEPLERRIDTLFRIETEHHGAFLLAVEAQRKKDPEKPASWSYYLAYLRNKYRLPPLLLVICQNRATAEWAARPESIGFHSWPSLTVRPIVAGPNNMPVITDPAQARQDLVLATLATITHGTSPDIEAILKTMTAALQDAPETVQNPIVEFISQGLGKLPAAAIWRKLVAVDLSFYKSPLIQEVREESRAEGQAEGLAEGLAEGQAEAVLLVLEQRGLDVPDDVRTRVTDCTDLDVLRLWLIRAITAPKAEEIFEDA